MGLTYKVNTDVVEEAFGLLLMQEMSAAGVPVIVYDPLADSKQAVGGYKGVRIAKDAEEGITEAGVVVLATPWPEFGQVPTARWARRASPRVVFDCWRAFGYLSGVEGIRYVRLGYGGEDMTDAATAHESRIRTQAQS